jgi:hypothetical protein
MFNQRVNSFLVLNCFLDYGVCKHVNLQIIQQSQFPNLLMQVSANLNHRSSMLIHVNWASQAYTG